MKKLILNCLIAASVVLAVSCNSNKSQGNADSTQTADSTTSASSTAAATDSTANTPDSAFANKAALGGLMEVQLGKLAQQKGASAAVVQFGTMMVNDHTMAAAMLDSIATSKKVALPKTLDDKFQQDYDKFAKTDKKSFDKTYIDYMVKDHKEDIEEYKKEAEKGKDAEFKAFAGKHVPILQKHLQKAQEIQKTLK
ncbi:DUF4142 domain-containing protein [Inquilinus sp. KBS0705]|nr:DUF4142 domain-containing protein [Inquilinus sp. KBS0705]